MTEQQDDAIPEIALVGELTDREGDLTERLLDVEPGGNCILYIDSPGGSAYTGMSLMSLIRLRSLQVTGIVTGECSSAALWPFAACTQRFVLPMSVMLFHPMRWQSEEHIGLSEAAEWARHFKQLEQDMDQVLADLFEVELESLKHWMAPGRYVSGRELATSGLAQLIQLEPFPGLVAGKPPERPTKRKSRKSTTNSDRV